MSESKPERDEVITTIRFSQEEHGFLKRLAAHENRSITGQVRHWVQELMRDEEREAA